MFRDKLESEELPEEEEVEEVVEEVEEKVVEEEESSKPPNGRRRKKEEEVKEEPKTTKKVVEKEEVPTHDERGFPFGTHIVNARLAKELVTNAGSRARNIAESVAYLGLDGSGRRFALVLSSWRVIAGGLFFVPSSLAGYKFLADWKKVEGVAPPGFVAFRAQ